MGMTPIISRNSDTLSWTRPSQPKIEIQLVGQQPRIVNSYTTGDQINGTAIITVEHETPFDEVEIVLQGSSHTTIDHVPCGRVGSEQIFLELRQPIEETAYLIPEVLEPGRSYSFSFGFVVPDRLLPQACTHARINPLVHRAHTMLPPTLGDPMLAGDGKTFLDDLAPDMSRISYIIRVGVFMKSPSDHRQLNPLAIIAKKVRIIPTVEEEPPINVLGHPYYCTSKGKSGRYGPLRTKLGRLLVSSSQPKPIRLLPPSYPRHNVSTVAIVRLRFDPVGNEQPPQLGSITSKLKASTFYSATPRADFPCQSGTISSGQGGQGLFSESIPLLTMCVSSAQWEKHSMSSESDRRESIHLITSENLDDPAVSFFKDNYYTTSVIIPITIPSSKTFVPTFHSCLVSRTYSLDLSLTYHTPGMNILTPTISLCVPIQITT
ncbi:hypothetical protein N7537_011651 [Penicillium hordei]|uniref:Arrestin-like N-terminal domain-containing protein n=1 Tax=Penicillium hordei TaxID=40994 RepID=A0AAD6GSZ0_9EURO|nr:uncharacterized protein N7537_011651 [Penicillium hordei]KAJ5588973.1 hypothetical protein N7537_011651 [Penicillium hordei]